MKDIRKILTLMEERTKGISGHLGFYYKELDSGMEFGVNETEEFLAASVIKLPIFLYTLMECEKGNASRNQILTVTPEEKVPGCGAVKFFTGNAAADISTLCKLMICISDNTATNALIRLFGIDEINKGFRNMGLEKTTLRRFLFDSEASSKGIENTICLKEMGMLLEKLYCGEFINEKVSKEAIDVLSLQQINHKMGGKLKGVTMAHKTGEDYMLSNDVGIVFSKSPFIICFAGHDTDVYEWEDFIRQSVFDLGN